MIARVRPVAPPPVGYDRIVDFEKTIREMQDTLTVIVEIERRQSALLKDHSQLLADHDRLLADQHRSMVEHDRKMSEIDDKLNALVSIVDGRIRGQRQ